MPREKYKSVTLEDIAKKAGVAISTVSRVINVPTLVKSKNVTKVRLAMEALGYDQGSGFVAPENPSPYERRKNESTFAILLLGDITLQWISQRSHIYMSVFDGIESALRNQGANCLIRTIPDESAFEAFVEQKSAVGYFLLRSPDGLTPPKNLSNYPVVTILGTQRPSLGDWASYSVSSMGEIASDVLLKSRKQKIFIFRSTPSPQFNNHRTSLVIEKIREQRLELRIFEDIHLIIRGPNHNHVNQEVISSFLNQISPEEWKEVGVFTETDMIAYEIHRQLKQKGLSDKEFPIIVSPDYHEGRFSELRPKIIGIDFHAEEIVKRAADLIRWRIQNKDAVRLHLMIEPTLVKNN